MTAAALAEILEHLLQAAGIPVERIGGYDEPVDWTSPAAIDAVLDAVPIARPTGGYRPRASPGEHGTGRTNRCSTGRPGLTSR